MSPGTHVEFSIVAQAVREDHADLNELVAKLRALAASLRDGQDLLEEFEAELIPHFASEQAEEYFGSLIAEQPHLLRQVEQLQRDHEQLTEDLDRLTQLAANARGSELGPRLERFLDAFEAHERAENALLQEFCLMDEGENGA